MCKLPVTRYQLAVRCSLSVVPSTHSPRLTPPQPESLALSYWLGLSLPIIEIEKLNSSHHNVFCFSLPQSGSQSDNLVLFGERGCQTSMRDLIEENNIIGDRGEETWECSSAVSWSPHGNKTDNTQTFTSYHFNYYYGSSPSPYT